jgi:S-methylmethionine-dependent homocysteine/selenocysteine methylase
VVLDGGMSNALESRGHDLSGPLWTARLLRDRPEEIAAVHRAYFAAGVARAVRDELADDGTPRLVAASVGPYGAVLADGSEYRGRYGLSAARLRDFYLPRAGTARRRTGSRPGHATSAAAAGWARTRSPHSRGVSTAEYVVRPQERRRGRIDVAEPSRLVPP